jgi:HlyD family secretion protein
VDACQARLDQARQEAGQHPIRLSQLRASLAATTASLSGARIQLRRQEDLFGRNLVNKSEVDIAREHVRELESSVEAAQAKLREAQAVDPQLPVQAAHASLEAARARLGKARNVLTGYVVRAPCDGTILTLAVRVGELAGQPNGPAPVLFCPDAPFVVRAEIDQEHASWVQVGQPVRVRDEMAGEGPWLGTVVRLGRLYTRRQHRTDPTQLSDVPTVECLVRLEKGHPPLRIGQRLRVSIYPAGS